MSHVRSTSSSRCDDRNTVRPSSTNSRMRLRNSRIPAGSRPFIGSSRIRSAGSASRQRAIPSRWRMPMRVRLDALVRTFRESHALERAADHAGGFAAARGGIHAQVLAPGQMRVEARLLDDRADAGERGRALRRERAGRAAASPREVARVSPSSMRMSVVLPAPFGPRKPNAQASGTLRSTPSTAGRSPKRLTRSRVSITRSVVMPITLGRSHQEFLGRTAELRGHPKGRGAP